MIFHILIIIFAIYMIEIKSNEDYTLWIIFLIFVSFPISLHLSFIFTTLFTSSKHLLINTILSFCILLPISFFGIFESSSSKLTSIVFKIFYIGGEIPIKIKDENNPNLEYQGKLIFLSPDNIFLSNNEEKIILERKNKNIIFIKE